MLSIEVQQPASKRSNVRASLLCPRLGVRDEALLQLTWANKEWPYCGWTSPWRLVPPRARLATEGVAEVVYVSGVVDSVDVVRGVFIVIPGLSADLVSYVTQLLLLFAHAICVIVAVGPRRLD